MTPWYQRWELAAVPGERHRTIVLRELHSGWALGFIRLLVSYNDERRITYNAGTDFAKSCDGMHRVAASEELQIPLARILRDNGEDVAKDIDELAEDVWELLMRDPMLAVRSVFLGMRSREQSVLDKASLTSLELLLRQEGYDV